MPRCHTDVESAGFSWLQFAPSFSFPVSRPPRGFSSHPIPLRRTANFSLTQTSPLSLPPSGRFPTQGGLGRHRVGLVGPKELISVSRKWYPQPPDPQRPPRGQPCPCTPPGPFRFLRFPPPSDPPGRLDPESSGRRREQPSRLLPLPAQNPANPLLGARRRGCRDGVQHRAPLRGPSTDLSLLVSPPLWLGSRLSSSLLFSFTAFLKDQLA